MLCCVVLCCVVLCCVVLCCVVLCCVVLCCVVLCLRILEVNLKLEVRMSLKKKITEQSSLHINLYTIFFVTDWQHCISNRVHSRLIRSYFDVPINNFKIL